MKLRRLPGRLAGLALLVAMMLTACAPVDTGTQTTTTAGGSAQGGSVVVAVTQEPDFLDPYLAEAAGTKEIIYNLFEGLLRLTPEATYEPWLASAYEVSEDGRSYTFTLRDGVSFHNGDPVTADDVVWSLKRGAGLLEDEGTVLMPQLGSIASVEAGSGTVTVTSDEADPNLISAFTAPILPAGYMEQNSEPVGTGPFVFKEYLPQQRLVVTRNESYWREGLPHLDEVEFRIVPSTDAAFVDLQAGRIDVFPYLTDDRAEQVEGDFNLIEAESNMVQLLALNNAVEPFDDVRVRQAVNLAVDKEELVELMFYGRGSILASGMSPAMGPYYNDHVTIEGESASLSGNLERAQELLEEAGYADGFDMTITVPSNYVIHVQTAEVIVEMLARAGITATLEPVDWGTWLSRVYSGRDHQSTIIALTFEYSPYDVLRRYASDSEENFINFSSEAFDEVFAEAARELDDEARYAAYQELQQILADEAASVFLQDPATLTAVSKELTGYTTYPQYVQDMAPVAYIEPQA